MPLLIDGEQRSEEWFIARKGKITASVAAACLGLDPYCSPRMAWKRINGHQTKKNARMLWGSANEGTARAAYEEETGNLVWETGFWIADDHPWLGASPDGLVAPDGLAELKCPYKLPAGASEAQRLQMIVQMIATGRQWVDFYCWTPSGTFLERIHRPARTQTDNLVARLEEFYQRYIVTGTEPPRRRKAT